MRRIKNHPIRSKRRFWKIVYWLIPTSFLGLILLTGLEDDPTRSGSKETLYTILAVFIVALGLFVLFFIPYLIILRRQKKRHRRKSFQSDYYIESEIPLTTQVLAPASIEYPSDQKRTPAIQKTKPRFRMRYALLILAAAVFYFFEPISNVAIVLWNDQFADSQIQEIADNSGLNYKGKALFYKATPELVNADNLNQVCPHDDITSIEYGCYIFAGNNMYILRVPDAEFKEIQYTTAVHETLHAAWVGISNDERLSTAALLKNVYDKSTHQDVNKLRESISKYGNDESLISSELHSFMGSEITDAVMGSDLTNYYRKYFTNRTASIHSNNQFNIKVERKVANLNSEAAQVERLAAELSSFKARYIDGYYGDDFGYNNNVNIYNARVDSYNRMRDEYNAEVEKFNTLLRIFYPSRSPIHAR